MPTTEPNAPAAPSINSIVANISSNEAKLLALERRLTGVDPGRPTSSGSILVGSFSQLPGDRVSTSPLPATTPGSATTPAALPAAAAAGPQFPPGAPCGGSEPASKRRRTAGPPDDNHPPTATTIAAAAAPASSPHSRPPLSDISPLGAVAPLAPTPPTAIEPAAATADWNSAVRHTASCTPLVAAVGTPPPPPLPAAAAAAAAPSPTPLSVVALPSHQLQPQTLGKQNVAAVTGDGGGGGAAGAPATSGKARARKRKQQDPKHEVALGVSAAAAAAAAGARAGVTTLATSPGGNGTAAAAAVQVLAGGFGALGASAPVSTPRITRGSAPYQTAGPQQDRAAAAAAAAGGGGGAPGNNPQTTPPGIARHLFEDTGTAAVAASGPGAGGRSSSSGAAGGNGRAVAAAPAAPPPAAPPSAQKRNIMSYYPPVLGGSTGGGGGGGGSAHMAAAAVDQNSRDSLPPSLQQLQRQQRLEVAAAAAAANANTPAADMAGDGDGGAMSLSELSALQLRQSQQQVIQLQAQVMQVQSALAVHQAAAGAEMERLRAELQARCQEVASLEEKVRLAEVALQRAAAGEAAARAGLEALRAASASEAARWSSEAAESARVASEREARYRGELARLVQGNARLERDLSRSQLSANSARLGVLTLMRTGPMQMAEVWEDGTAFQQLAARRATLTATKEEVMAAQKLLRKRLAPPPSGPRGGGGGSSSGPAAAAVATLSGAGGEESNSVSVHDLPYMSGLEFVAADEVYKTRLAVLKREEESLREEEEKLNREKIRQIRAVKLSREEDASRFGRWPVLPDRPGPEGRPRYVLMNLLGKGGFSEVFKAYDLVEVRPVCVKIHALAPGWPSAKKESYVRHAIREYDIHRSLRHPAVVTLLDVLEIDLDTFATVLELCEGGDLEGVMREHRTLPEREARCVMAQIFSGLRYLASRRVIHYDLKPANILFDVLGQAKITDFGLSKQVSEGQTLAGIELTSQGAGTYWYLPPEAFETGGPAPPRISSKLDVWSAGVIFYSMLYGKKPYGEAMSQEQMLRERVMAVPREVDFPARPPVSSEAKDFIRRCLAWNQDNRPDVEAAATDSYITGCTATTGTAIAAVVGSGSGGGGGGSSSTSSKGGDAALGLRLAVVANNGRR